MNYYELFGVPEKPRVDNTYVSKKYLQLQKQFHPDFFSDKDEEEKNYALEQSAIINKAVKTFKNEDLALEYFLKSKEVIADDDKYELPADFLMEMMDINELLTEDEEKAKLEVQNFEDSLRSDAEGLLNREGSFTDAELQQLKEYYYKKKYLHRILERLQD